MQKQRLQLDLTPSPLLSALLFVWHLATAILILCLPLLWWYAKLAILIIVCISLRYNLRRYAWLTSPKAVIQVICLPYGYWRLVYRNGNQRSVTLAGDSYCANRLVILLFKDPRWGRQNRKRWQRWFMRFWPISVPICFDALGGDRDKFRQLRMFLLAAGEDVFG